MDALNYHHLRYFWAVARYGSLTQACKELYLTPQTVSSQIRVLEAALDETLFDRSGKRMVLTDKGQLVFRYANEIFGLGNELVNTIKERTTGHPLRLTVGIVDVVPKLIAQRLIQPALSLKEPVRVTCREGQAKDLFGDLAVKRLDVVLSDSPIPLNIKVRAFNHILGECGVVFMGTKSLTKACRKGFPLSLNGQPILLPTETTNLRRELDQWFSERGIHPKIVAEFEDSALLKSFGQAGNGIFAVPMAVEREVRRQFGVVRVGIAEGIVEQFYAISVERKVKHPAVGAICKAARSELFA